VRPATTDDEERKHPSDERDSEADVDSAAEAAAEQLRSLDLQHGELTDREKRQAEELKQMKVQLSKTIDKLNVAQRAVVKTGKELKESKATIDALNKTKTSQLSGGASPNRKRKNVMSAVSGEGRHLTGSQNDNSASMAAPVTPAAAGAHRQLIFTSPSLTRRSDLINNLPSPANHAAAAVPPIPPQSHLAARCLVATGLGLQSSAQINEVASAFGSLLRRAGVATEDLTPSQRAAMLPVYVFKLGQPVSAGARAISWKLVFRDEATPANLLKIYNGNDLDGAPLVPQELKWNGVSMGPGSRKTHVTLRAFHEAGGRVQSDVAAAAIETASSTAYVRAVAAEYIQSAQGRRQRMRVKHHQVSRSGSGSPASQPEKIKVEPRERPSALRLDAQSANCVQQQPVQLQQQQQWMPPPTSMMQQHPPHYPHPLAPYYPPPAYAYPPQQPYAPHPAAFPPMHPHPHHPPSYAPPPPSYPAPPYPYQLSRSSLPPYQF